MLDKPSEGGRVNEPDRRRLFLSDMTADVARDWACFSMGRWGVLFPELTTDVVGVIVV